MEIVALAVSVKCCRFINSNQPTSRLLLQSPVISCYDFTFDVGGQDWYGTSLPPSMLGMASDNCVFGYAGVTVNFQGGEPTFGCADVDTVHSITMEATDDSGNTATCVSSVTVIDSLVRNYLRLLLPGFVLSHPFFLVYT